MEIAQHDTGMAREKQDSLSEQIAKLQQKRIEDVKAILDECGPQLRGITTIPTAEIRIVPRGG